MELPFHPGRAFSGQNTTRSTTAKIVDESITEKQSPIPSPPTVRRRSNPGSGATSKTARSRSRAGSWRSLPGPVRWPKPLAGGPSEVGLRPVPASSSEHSLAQAPNGGVLGLREELRRLDRRLRARCHGGSTRCPVRPPSTRTGRTLGATTPTNTRTAVAFTGHPPRGPAGVQPAGGRGHRFRLPGRPHRHRGASVLHQLGPSATSG